MFSKAPVCFSRLQRTSKWFAHSMTVMLNAGPSEFFTPRKNCALSGRGLVHSVMAARGVHGASSALAEMRLSLVEGERTWLQNTVSRFLLRTRAVLARVGDTTLASDAAAEEVAALMSPEAVLARLGGVKARCFAHGLTRLSGSN